MILHELTTEHRSKSDAFTLYAIGDLHVGAKHFDRRAFERAVQTIREDESALWVGMGDYAESIIPGDKRWDFSSIDTAFHSRLGDLPQACFEYIRDKFNPIKGRCIGLLTGNHEDTLRTRQSQDIHGALCLALGVKNLGYNAAIRWRFKRPSTSSTAVIVYATHSRIAARRDGGKLNRMQDQARFIGADLLLFGHGHSTVQGGSASLEFTRDGAFKMRQRVQQVAMCGTFRRTYDEDCLSDYGEQSGFEPTVLGMQKVVVKPWAPDPSDRVTVT